MKKTVVTFAVLVLFTVLIYSNVLNNDFIWDDRGFVEENIHIKKLSNIPSFFTLRFWKHDNPGKEGTLRPVRLSTFAINYALGQNNPFVYHLTNVLFHTFNVVVLYFLLLQFAAMLTLPVLGGYRRYFQFPFLASLLFASHPIHVESVAWIKNRSDPMALLFVLVSFLTFIYFLRNKTRAKRWMCYGASLLSFIAAILSKEVVIVFPVMLALYVVYFTGRKNLIAKLLAVMPFFLVSAIDLLLSRFVLLAPSSFYPLGKIDYFLTAQVVSKTLGYYLWLLIFPVNLNAERPFTVAQSPFDLTVLGSALAVGILLFWTVKLALRKNPQQRLVSFFLAWILICLLPVSNLIFLVSRPIAEQRLYIPSLGFCVVVGLGIHAAVSFRARRLGSFKHLNMLAGLGAVALVILYVVTVYQRNFDWKDEMTFWTKTVQQSPRSVRAFYNLGSAYFGLGKLEKSIAAYHRALKLSPDDYDTMLNLANVYFFQDRYQDALAWYQKATDKYPDLPEAWNNVGFLHHKFGRLQDALDCYEKAMAIAPLDPVGYNNAITLYITIEQYQEAVDISERAIKAGVRSPVLYYNQGLAYYYLKKPDEAIDAFKKTVFLDPGFAPAYLNLAKVYFSFGDYQSAQDYYEKASALRLFDAEFEHELATQRWRLREGS
ncbi:MAG: tetratricopeptide repeat protein [Candidatus Omnitrophica bacterium]|nr:tetratricopeptide repeat protein [Candidatus Omnitrophota bacterium]